MRCASGLVGRMQNKALSKVLDRVRMDPEVLAVMLFGSAARGEDTPRSDLDVCLVLEPGTYDRLTLSRKLHLYLSHTDLDLHLFQHLPLYVRRRVLKEGRVLFCRNEDRLYLVAFRTAQAFEDFRYRYNRYLDQVADAGS